MNNEKQITAQNDSISVERYKNTINNFEGKNVSKHESK